jgi:uncharacterized membrane protein
LESITFQPILTPVVLTIVFAFALLMLLIGPSFAKLTARRRLTLTLLRTGVILLALCAAVRPGCVKTIEKSQAAVLLFLVDVTRSMELPHISDDSTRWAATVEMLKENESRFKQLADNDIDVKIYGFDNQTTVFEIVDGVVSLPAAPTGSETDIGTAIYNASLEARDQRVLAMFVASDGRQNVLEPDIELSQATDGLIAREAPLIAIQLGMPGDTGQFADLAITSFAEQHVVNKKNDLLARATLVARGYAGQDVNVELIVTDAAGAETRVASEIVRPSSTDEEMNVTLKYQPTVPGEYRIKVRAVPMPNEPARRNNELDGFLTVRDEGMRVLFINGPLGNEQLALRRSLPALDFVMLEFEPIYTYARERESRWPIAEFEAKFSDPIYDVFILCNVDSTTLTQESWQALTDAVLIRGKGLLMLGGSHSFGAGQFYKTPLAEILPIKMQPNEEQKFDQDVRRDLHINTPFKLRPTKNNFLTRISDSGNREAWSKLPPLPGANRIAVKRGTAEVFIESDDDVKRPILVGGPVGGKGRVLVFAGDSTWRWRRYGFEKEFNRFWRQVVLWLASWDSRDDETVSINLPKRRFSPKAIVKFGVDVKSIDGERVKGVEFDATLMLPSGDVTSISVNQLGDQYQSELDPESLAASGLYRIRIAASRGGVPIGVSEREFVVMDRDKEKSNPVANPEQMKRLADQTSEFGGRAIAPEQVASILDGFINDPPMTKIEIPTQQRLGGDFWSSFWFLVIFVSILATEWWLRKKWGLV